MKQQQATKPVNQPTNTGTMKLKKLTILMLVSSIPFTPIHANVQEVRVGDYTNSAVHPIESFKEKIRNLGDMQTNNAETLKRALDEFENCDHLLGHDAIDKAQYTECTIQASEASRDAYGEIKGVIDTQVTTIGNYLTGVEADLKQSKESLKHETKLLDADEKMLDQLRVEAKAFQEAVASLDGNDLSLEQQKVFMQLVDQYQKQEQMKMIHQNGIDNINLAIEKRNQMVEYLRHMVIKLERLSGQAGDNQELVTEYIRVSRVYGKIAADLSNIDVAAMSLDTDVPALEVVLSDKPGLTKKIPGGDSLEVGLSVDMMSKEDVLSILGRMTGGKEGEANEG